MPLRSRLGGLAALVLLTSAPLPAANLDGASTAAGNAEAARLYAEANDFVSTMKEGRYSYAYLQFYWKHAQADVDRARRVYPDSPTAHAIARGELKLGPFPLDYFRERVLFNLERKRLAAFDDVNCAIFLYGLDEKRDDPVREEALSRILEVMARRQRWGEVMAFPVLDEHRPLLLRSVFRVAADYDQKKIVESMLKEITPTEQAAAGFDPIQAEAMALLGKPRLELYRFVDDHPADAVRLAALKGVVDRAILIRRKEALRLALGETIPEIHYSVEHLNVRDDVPEIAQRLFPGRPETAAPLLAVYLAANGSRPSARAPVDAHLAYLRFLADREQLDAMGAYADGDSLSAGARRACELKAIELYAEAGLRDQAERRRKAFAAGGTPEGDQAALAEFTGRMDSTNTPLVVRETSFADLPISDPCLLAVAIMDWSLSPNRSQRGATPWDAVVTKVEGGFDNLPEPDSTAVSEAASAVKPY
jgi:hypothetical protein